MILFCNRINCLMAICLCQAWMMWNFINFHLKRMREKALELQAKRKTNKSKPSKLKTKHDDVNDLPEVDQNTKMKLKKKVK